MAKQYTTVVVEGRTLSEVERCLAQLVGPMLEPWRRNHLLGVHCDVSDTSEAVRYGLAFEPAGDAVQQPAFPVVEIDLYARSDRPTGALRRAIADLLAAGLADGLGARTSVRDDDGQ